MDEPRRIVVGAAIIYDMVGHYLIAQRHTDDPHVGGLWEFPGGKLEPDESIQECIVREVAEELAIVVSVGDFFMCVNHMYSPNHYIELHAYLCRYVSGDPQPIACQAVRWVGHAELAALPFAAADVLVAEALKHRNFA